MENTKLTSQIQELKQTLLDHVELTGKRADSIERNLRLTSTEIDTIFKGVVGNIDAYIELCKNIFSVSFTGYIALNVVNPDWVNPDTQKLTLVFMALSLFAMALLTHNRTTQIERVIEIARKRIEAADKLLTAEEKCISDIDAKLSELTFRK